MNDTKIKLHTLSWFVQRVYYERGDNPIAFEWRYTNGKRTGFQLRVRDIKLVVSWL